MSNGSSQVRLLVKTKPGVPEARLRIGKATLHFKAEPLFRSIGVTRGRMAAAAPATWHVLAADTGEGLAAPTDLETPWDLCHRLVSSGLGIAGADVEFAEPDLQQRWPVGRPGALAVALTQAPSAPQPQNPNYPNLPNNFWFRDQDHAQWDRALAANVDPGDGNRIRVAHFDTGYDPQHLTLPKFLNRTQQRNFVDPNRPNDASDDSSSLINNLGHGTGTLSILAGAGIDGVNGGKPFGCAPFAEIIPVRVADSVVLFWNSAIAQAFDYVHGLCTNPATFVHVITMSMGGLPSQSWADAVNALYEAGVFIVTAAGNNYANAPTRYIVYPAHFARVVAACGVMANQTPYADLAPGLMAGNYGPLSKMDTALAAYTPNTPWARFGAPGIVDHNGNGTSAATPQIAAAAALWIQKNRAAYDRYPQPWMRVEAVRQALFEGTHTDRHDKAKNKFGRGRLAVSGALAKAPATAQNLRDRKLPPDRADLGFLKLLTGLGVAPDAGLRRAMLELEALQIMGSMKLETPIPDFAATGQAIDPRDVARLADELLSKAALSKALGDALESTTGVTPVSRPTDVNRLNTPAARSDALHVKMALDPESPLPVARRLRVYAYDPSLSSDLVNFDINVATISIGWEKDLKPGPVGEYIEVVDVDPASGSCYAPVDLNHPRLLAEEGLAPSESNPQFHQQMCYAVAMRTIEAFERALGRRAMWSSHYVRDNEGKVLKEEFVPRLRIYPHALRTANSFYSSERRALLLGYFRADSNRASITLPGSRVFCAVSHDIIAHETTHALLDGLHRRYQESTNPDVLAFHEAFADIVAMFQHFSLPESLIAVIRKTRGDLEKDNLLAKLAIQFGQATTGSYEALRDALRDDPKVANYQNYAKEDPHKLGSVLVAAVFAAFLSIYRSRAADLIRLATEGTGVLKEGDIPEDLVRRLTDEASKAARHVLGICIRALDYCPPVDITFGEYLRALITADYDVVRDDVHGYRVAFISAFRNRGILPIGVQHLEVDSLLWEPPMLPEVGLEEITTSLDLRWNIFGDRAQSYKVSKNNARAFHDWLVKPEREAFISELGFRAAEKESKIAGFKGELRPLEVHSVRPARRIGPDGQSRSDIVVEITQTFWPTETMQHYRGGCTLLIDLQNFKPRYLIRKRLEGSTGLAQQHAFRIATADEGALRASFYGSRPRDREPFALLHGRH
jgi:Subtilase family